MSESAVTPTSAQRSGLGLRLPRPRQPLGVVATPAAQEVTRAADVQAPRRVRSLRRVVRALVVADAAVLGAAIALAWPARDLVPGVVNFDTSGSTLALGVAPLLLVVWMVSLLLAGGYARRSLGAGTDEFRAVGKATLVTAFVASSACFLADLPLSRGFLVAAMLNGLLLLLAERFAVRRWIHRQRADGALTHRVLVVGSRTAVKRLTDVLGREQYLGYDVVACTLTDPGRSADVELEAPVVGSMHDVSATCARLGVDTVMVAGGTDLHLREITWSLEGKEVDLVVVPHLADVSAARLQMRPVAGLPLLHVEEPQARQAGQWPKRVFDLVGAGFGLLTIAPVMLVVAALIKLGDGGPVFYRQNRVGLHGTVFRCWKFRSMAVDADRIDAQLRAQHGYTEGLFKLERDPRVTPVGRFLRRTSIDELPQLFNVIAGTMSLVGPRPHMQVEVDTYDDTARRRLRVRPGMTGLWQVSGRSNLSWADAVRLDLHYCDNWSMLRDLGIILKTVRAVTARDGAY